MVILKKKKAVTFVIALHRHQQLLHQLTSVMSMQLKLLKVTK